MTPVPRSGGWQYSALTRPGSENWMPLPVTHWVVASTTSTGSRTFSFLSPAGRTAKLAGAEAGAVGLMLTVGVGLADAVGVGLPDDVVGAGDGDFVAASFVNGK